MTSAKIGRFFTPLIPPPFLPPRFTIVQIDTPLLIVDSGPPSVLKFFDFDANFYY